MYHTIMEVSDGIRVCGRRAVTSENVKCGQSRASSRTSRAYCKKMYIPNVPGGPRFAVPGHICAAGR